MFNTNIIKALMLLPLGAACLASCSNEEYLGGYISTDGMGTVANVKATISSKMYPDATLPEGDIYGLSTGYSDNTSVNRQYVSKTLQDSVYSGLPIYLKASTTLQACYPYSGEEGSELTLPLSTAKQQSVEPVYFGMSDNVVPGTSNIIPVVLKNVYGNVVFSITVPEGETLRSYRLSNVYQNAVFNTIDGSFTYENNSSDLTGSVTGNTLSLVLIPQTVTADQNASITFVGKIRSYTIDLADMTVTSDETLSANVNLTDGIGTIEFTDGGAQWTNSNAGGDITSEK